MLSANHTNPNMNTSVSVCISVPDQNLLSLTVMLCFAVVSIFFYLYGIFNGNTFFQISKKFTFRNITYSGDGLVLEFFSSITTAAYCILSVWLSNGTPVGAVVVQFLYLIIVINTLQRLTRWCLPVAFLRKYAMTMATITSQFVRVFHLVIFFSLIL